MGIKKEIEKRGCIGNLIELGKGYAPMGQKKGGVESK
jgi:hypothetical protein